MGKDVFCAPSADVIGSVNLGDQVSVWFGAVIRGDTDIINIGAGSNVQDTAVLYTDPGIQAYIGCHITICCCALFYGCTFGAISLTVFYGVSYSYF